MNEQQLANILIRPIISEKTNLLAETCKQFTFSVDKRASKKQVKDAVESMFDVKVESVQVTNVKGKAKRTGAHLGRRSNWKKAYVALKEGHDIDFVSND